MSGRRTTLIAGILVVAAGSLGLTTRAARQDRDLAQRVAALEILVAAQQHALAAAETEIDELRRIVRAVKGASDGLSEALDTSRKNGFEWAGPNPQSKTDLLNGLIKFSQAIQSAVEPPEKEGK